MVLADEYSFEAKCFVTNPQVKIARERFATWSGFGSIFGVPSSGTNSNTHGLIHRRRLSSAGVIARLDTRQAF
jgi:hypothetical protein